MPKKTGTEGNQPRKQVSVRLGQDTMQTIEQIAEAMNRDREVKKLRSSDVVIAALDMGLKALKTKYNVGQDVPAPTKKSSTKKSA